MIEIGPNLLEVAWLIAGVIVLYILARSITATWN